MTTGAPPTKALGNLPDELRTELLQAFSNVVDNFRLSHWEPAELNGGKFSEVVYSILRGHIDGKYPKKAKKPPRFDQACKDLENADAKLFTRSIRVHIPRVLVALYEVRNNRGVGHVGGDVDPNHMDAVWVLASVKWVVAELVRIFHDIPIAEAQGIVDALTDRTIPSVWEVNGRRRVLHPKLGMKEKTLLLLYGISRAASVSELIDWTEHSNAAVFRRDILKKAHKNKLIEYDQINGIVFLSPLGARFVEEHLPLEI